MGHSLVMFRFSLALIGALLVSGIVGTAAEAEVAVRKRPITPEGYLDIVGVLALRVELPEEKSSLKAVSPVWKFSDGSELAAKLNFEELPTGQEVQLFFWIDEWSDAASSEGIRYVIQYKSERRRYEQRTGVLPLPDSFGALTTSLSDTCDPGILIEGDSLLKFENPEGSCELRLRSLSDSPQPDENRKRKGRCNPITPGELYRATGVLGWRIYLYPDLLDSEYLTFEWRDAPKGQEDSGFSFEGFPPGQEVEAYVMMGEWQEGTEKERIRCRMRYRQKDGERVIRDGEIRVPRSFTDLYSNLGAGDTLDGGWILMLTNGAPSGQIFLEKVYRYAE